MAVDKKVKQSTYLIGGILLIIIALVAIDVRGDFKADGLSWHIGLEILIGILSSLAFYWLINSRETVKDALIETKERLQKNEDEYKAYQVEAEKWKSEARTFIQGLSKSIDKQFENWMFSPAEKDVALLLIKGLSLKEIAEVRQTSEKTVRTQSLAIYAKSQVKGRNELAAFFLEDLLAPTNK